MTFPSISGLNYPTEEDVLAAMLNSVRHGYSTIGINLNVQPGTEIFYRCRAVASRVALLVQNNRISLSGISPLTAEEDELIELASVFGVFPRPASSAAGNVVVSFAAG